MKKFQRLNHLERRNLPTKFRKQVRMCRMEIGHYLISLRKNHEFIIDNHTTKNQP